MTKARGVCEKGKRDSEAHEGGCRSWCRRANMVTPILTFSVFGPAALTSALLANGAWGQNAAPGPVRGSFCSVSTFQRFGAEDQQDGASEAAAPAPSERGSIHIFFPIVRTLNSKPTGNLQGKSQSQKMDNPKHSCWVVSKRTGTKAQCTFESRNDGPPWKAPGRQIPLSPFFLLSGTFRMCNAL